MTHSGAITIRSSHHGISSAAPLLFRYYTYYTYPRRFIPKIIRISRSIVGSSGERLHSAVTPYTRHTERGHVLVSVAVPK